MQQTLVQGAMVFTRSQAGGQELYSLDTQAHDDTQVGDAEGSDAHDEEYPDGVTYSIEFEHPDSAEDDVSLSGAVLGDARVDCT